MTPPDISLREYYAGLFAAARFTDDQAHHVGIPPAAVALADALILELRRTRPAPQSSPR